MLAITRARSTNPGSVTPSRCRRSLYTRTPLTAISPILATLIGGLQFFVFVTS